MITTHCPDRETLFAYSVGRLADDQSDEVANHLSSCPDCQAEIQTLDDRGDTLLNGLRTAVDDPCLEEPQLGNAVDEVLARGGRSQASGASESRLAGPKLLGEYRLLEELGRGGMGRVYLALHTKLDRVVALKILPKSRLEEPQAMARFEREMRAIGQLKHRNIVHAYDAREIDGQPVLIMEFIDGFDLAELVRRLGRLEVADACELVRQAAVGLQYAHEHNLVHRDVKPSNLMLSREGEVKLLDLGLARLYGGGLSQFSRPENVHSPTDAYAAKTGLSPSAPSVRQKVPVPFSEMTDTGQAMGTADYMAPEQANDSRGVDIRADLYSLGCTLYKLLAGRAPFAGPDYRGTFEKMTAHAREPIPPIRQFVPGVPEGVCAILERLLAKEPEERFATPVEVAETLEPFCTGADLVGLSARAAAASGAVGEREGPVANGGRSAETAVRFTHPTGRSWRPWIMLTAVGLVLLGIGGGFWLGVVIKIHKDGRETRVEVPEESTAHVGADASVDVTLPSQKQSPPRPDQAKPTPAEPATPPAVEVRQPLVREISDHVDSAGIIEPVQSVEIRARVTGSLERIHFKAGTIVKQGDPLFDIDVRPLELEIAKQAAEVERLQIQLKQHTAELEGAKSPSAKDRQQIETQRAAAEAALRAAQSALDLSRVNFAYSKVIAPMSGRISRPMLAVGNLVEAGSTKLATIDSVDPMCVKFSVNEATVLRLHGTGGIAVGKTDGGASLEVLFGLGGDKDYPRRGKLESADSQIYAGEATWRATTANPDGVLMPGMFARVRLITSAPYKALMVPASAVVSTQNQTFVFVITSGNVVERRPVEARPRDDEGLWAVTEGLTANDRVVVSGVDKLKPGMIVKPEGAVGLSVPEAVGPVAYRTAKITRGEVVATVNATGTLEPEEVMEVGAQVSGRIIGFGDDPRGKSDPKFRGKPVDYGTPVEEGTVLAKIDETMYRLRVEQEQAALKRAEAELELAKVANKPLAAAEAAVVQSKAAVKQAEINLDRTAIKSPIKGVVIDRRVNIGQTVASDTSGPSLFLIAEDLGRMQVWASVDEADIGRIRQGMKVRFAVDALPKASFQGTVTQIRPDATRKQGLVAYTVIIHVENPDSKLLPYMTANVEFEIERHENVLLVPNGALRWRPPADRDTGRTNHDRLWLKEGQGLRPIDVQVGLRGETMTEVSGPEVKEGMEVVVGVVPSPAGSGVAPGQAPVPSPSGDATEAERKSVIVYEMRHNDARTVAELLKILEGSGARIEAQGSGRLMILATKREHERIAAFLETLEKQKASGQEKSGGAAALQADSVTPVADLKALAVEWRVLRVEKGKHSHEAWAEICEFPSSFEPATTSRFDFGGVGQAALVVKRRVPTPEFRRPNRLGFLPSWYDQDFDYRVDLSAKPKTIDVFNSLAGRSSDSTPRLAALGIYEIEGERMRICLRSVLPRVAGDQRPKAFSVDPDSGDILFVLEQYRVPDAEKELQGMWNVEVETVNGARVSDNERLRRPCLFRKDHASIPDRRIVPFVIETAQDPKWITFFGRSIAQTSETGNLFGIYKLEANRLTIAYREDGPRPTKFESEAGSGVTMLLLGRKIGPHAPETAATAATRNKGVGVHRDGTITLDQETVTLEQLTEKLTAARAEHPGLGVMVRSDREVKSERVAEVVDACKRAGVKEVAVSAREDEQKK